MTVAEIRAREQKGYEERVNQVAPIPPGFRAISDEVAVGDTVFARKPEFGHSEDGDKVVEIRDYLIFIGQEDGIMQGSNRAWLMVKDEEQDDDDDWEQEMRREAMMLHGAEAGD